MNGIEGIGRLGRSGASATLIARNTGVSEPTVRKYLREGVLSERPQEAGHRPESPLLEPHADLIDSWLRENRRRWHKQRHTSRRVHDKLVEERGFAGSYSTIQRYARRRREELAIELDAREAQGFLLPDWTPGECQADFRVRGVVTCDHIPVATYPNLDVGLV